MTTIVNTRTLSGAGMERALVEMVVGILRSVGWLGEVRVHGPERSTADGVDAIVHVRLAKGREVEFRVHAKKEIRPSAFLAWAALRNPSKEKTISVLAMPFVSSRIVDLCKQAGWSWCDLAGNCRIDVPGSVQIERGGIPPVQRPPRSGANLGTAAAARVLRALLSPGRVGKEWTQRSLQKDTSWKFFGREEQLVSLGLVNKVIRHLRDQGFVEEVDTGGVRVRDPGGLLAAWNKAYRFDVHERRSYFSLLKGAQLHDALYRVGAEAGGMAAYAVFSAAERQAPHVRQPKTWLYIAPAFLDSLTRHTQAKEVDSGENLAVLVPADLGVFVSFDADAHVKTRTIGCTDPVQTYVDLAHCGGRGEEAAQAMLDQKILPAWKAVARA